MKQAAPEEFISVPEAAKRMGMAPETVRDALQQGTFPVGCAFRKYGRRTQWVYRIPRKPFETWITGESNA